MSAIAVVSASERPALVQRPDKARALVARGARCDRCEGRAVTNIHDGHSVAFLCASDFLARAREDRATRVPGAACTAAFRSAPAA